MRLCHPDTDAMIRIVGTEELQLTMHTEIYDQLPQVGDWNGEAWLSYWRNVYEADLGAIIGYWEDGALCGIIGFTTGTDPASGVHCLYELVWAVWPEHRGKGIGGKLLNTLEQYAAQSGKVLIMASPSASVDAIYQGRGYIPGERAWIRKSGG